MDPPASEFAVRGMICGHCVQAIQKGVATLPGIVAAHVDLATGRLRVQGRPEPGAVERTVQKLGYEVHAT